MTADTYNTYDNGYHWLLKKCSWIHSLVKKEEIKLNKNRDHSLKTNDFPTANLQIKQDVLYLTKLIIFKKSLFLIFLLWRDFFITNVM